MINTRRVTLYCNEKSVTPEQPARIYPGRSNRLTVTTNSTFSERTGIRVDTTSPDGRVHTQSLSGAGQRAEFELGPFCAPAVFEYEAGMVFRRGYSCRITLINQDDKSIITRFELAAVCSREKDSEWLALGAPACCLYNDGYIPTEGASRVGSASASWNPFSDSSGAMQPALQIRLAPEVLMDQDRITVRYRTRPEPPVGSIQARLRILAQDGREMLSSPDLEVDAEWREWRPEVADWPSGDYTVELLPELDGRCWPDGPRLSYRRAEVDPKRIQVSPYAPYTLNHDSQRRKVEITKWPDNLPDGWEVAQYGDGQALFNNGDPDSFPVVLDPQLQGTYAVLVEAVNSILIQVGDQDIIRRVDSPENAGGSSVLVTVDDLGGKSLRFYANNLTGLLQALGEESGCLSEIIKLPGTAIRNQQGGEVRSGVKRISLIPVTSESAAEFKAHTADPPYELRGVDDWWCYFRGWDRAESDQLETIIQGQREIGIKTLNWAVGRSWVQYPSQLPRAKVFPCSPVTPDLLRKSHPHFVAWQRIVEAVDCLGYPLRIGSKNKVRIQGWLAMNRHYSPQAHGGVFTSPWARENQQYCQYHKDQQTVDVSRMEYYFPEVRRERLDILEEVAGYSPDAIILGCCRQPPMAGYNPAMVAAYKKETGIDPGEIDIEDGQPYLDWIQWRADFFTELLRELRERLAKVAQKTGNRVPVAARIPGAGLLWNLAQGMDIRTWIEEDLIDELQLDPLQCAAAGEACHDVRPYLALGRKYGVPIFGGVNGTTGAYRGVTQAERGEKDQDYSPVPGLRRAIGLLRAGVDGIEIYEAEVFAACSERRWLIPLWGDPERAARWLAESNLEAVFPVTARNAALGHDNHWFGGETMRGTRALPRSAKRAL